MRGDPEYFRLAALEIVNEQTGEIAKGPVFTGNILVHDPKPTVRSAQDAMLAILNDKGSFDLEETARLYGKSVPETVIELGDGIFELPTMPGRWTLRDEYLSGDVKTKLASAREKAVADPRFERNVKALEAVVPPDLVPSEISVSIGAKWLPPEMVQSFATHLGFHNPRVSYAPATGQYQFRAWTATGRTRNGA